MTQDPVLPRSPAAWHRRVWSLAVPIILANISVPLVGAVDTAVVGHLPEPVYIGAVALGALIFSFLFWGFGFLRMGTTGYVAQARGADDPDESNLVLLRALLLAACFGTLLLILQQPIGRFSLWLLEGGAELEALTGEYYSVRIWSAPAALANYAVLGYLIGLQNTRAALLLQLVLNLTNVMLDLLFVLVFEWGVQGVAVASVLSEYLALLVGLFITRQGVFYARGSVRVQHIFHQKKLAALLRTNINILIRTLCLVFAFAYFTAQGVKFGETVLAANAVLMQFQNILAYGLDGFANAVEALAGGAYGAKRKSAFRAAVFYTTVWALVLACVITLIFILMGSTLVGLLTDIETVRGTAMHYLPWILISPLVSMWSFQLDGIYIGVTRTAEMRNAMLLSLLIFFAAVWLLVPLWANHGLWLSLMIFMMARAITLGIKLPSIDKTLTG